MILYETFYCIFFCSFFYFFRWILLNPLPRSGEGYIMILQKCQPHFSILILILLFLFQEFYFLFFPAFPCFYIFFIFFFLASRFFSCSASLFQFAFPQCFLIQSSSFIPSLSVFCCSFPVKFPSFFWADFLKRHISHLQARMKPWND